VEERRRVLSCECQFLIGSYIFPEDLRDPESSTCTADFRIPVDTGRPLSFGCWKRLLAAFSLRSEARRTETVRLAPSLAAALPEDLFEHPQDL
jgi:hypothetical protein